MNKCQISATATFKRQRMAACIDAQLHADSSHGTKRHDLHLSVYASITIIRVIVASGWHQGVMRLMDELTSRISPNAANASRTSSALHRNSAHAISGIFSPRHTNTLHQITRAEPTLSRWASCGKAMRSRRWNCRRRRALRRHCVRYRSLRQETSLYYTCIKGKTV